MEIVRHLDERLWREFVDHYSQGNIFHTPEMFQVFGRAQDHMPELWATVKDGRVLALLLPVRITLMGGLLRCLTTRAVVYGGVLCAPGIEGREALAMLLRTYRCKVNGDFLFTELRNLSDLSDIQVVLNKGGFAYEEHLNFLIDLALPIDKVWKNIHDSTRKNIRKAVNKGHLKIEEVHNRTQVATCYSILQKTYSYANVPFVDRSLFEAAFDILYPKGMAKFLLGQVEGNCVAASVALIYKGVIYGWYRGFDRAYSTYLPNDLMVWYILKWGVENNCSVFDFGGAGRPGERYGPRDFKAKFGGELVNYGRNVCVHAPLALTISKKAYALMRRFLSTRWAKK